MPAIDHPTMCPPKLSRRFCVAPMLDHTDRHFRYFARLLSRRALLYTEMLSCSALLHGDAARFLRHHPSEHPLALQLGGSRPKELAACAKMAEQWGYAEVNLNVGCPSNRVQNHQIGACLMAQPALVADCVKAMRDACALPVTVKHRIGIDGHDSYAELRDFVGQLDLAGCQAFIVHARIAVLSGLSPKQNREIPPLRYDLAAQLVRDFPHQQFILNGGITDLDQCRHHLASFYGVMLGREAYRNPFLLAEVDGRLFDDTPGSKSAPQRLRPLRGYLQQHLTQGGAAHQITRHLLGLAKGQTGARRFRQLLSVDIHKESDPLRVYDQAMALLERESPTGS